ncbi:MAG: ParB N-terminal domain-containing protein [Desulfosalsimonas sp.]
MSLVFRIESIEPNRRVVIENDVVEELVQSIFRQGQLEPILICQQGTVFRIIDGEKRWRAIKRLGRLTILAEIEKG